MNSGGPFRPSRIVNRSQHATRIALSSPVIASFTSLLGTDMDTQSFNAGMEAVYLSPIQQGPRDKLYSMESGPSPYNAPTAAAGEGLGD